MRILEEFWYGNIEPTEYDTSSKEYKKLQELICRNEEKLKTTMTDEQKELFVYPSAAHNASSADTDANTAAKRNVPLPYAFLISINGAAANRRKNAAHLLLGREKGKANVFRTPTEI